jgi:hypothetical protein
MGNPLRSLARRLSGVRRVPTYYLPWITHHPELTCVLLLNNIQARFTTGYTQGPFPVVVSQYDEAGGLVRRTEAVLADNTSPVEVTLDTRPSGCGFVTVDGERVRSGHYVALVNGTTYTATHGRGEFIEYYPAWTRAAAAVVGGVLALFGRTIPVFTRGQYVHASAASRVHLLVMNLSNVTNRIRVILDGSKSRVVTLPPMGAHLLNIAPQGSNDVAVRRVRLEGNAWFNLYVLGAGARDVAGPLSLMHVK